MVSRELQLQPRLKCIASLVRQGARLADVGTDHGYLPVWLLQQGRIARAIASDINQAPLDHARATAAEYGVTAAMDFRLCPGLAGIRAEECDTIVIAGMGGETILSILEDARWTRDGAHMLILQPQTKVSLLRRWLSENGYRFLEEVLVQDKGQIYVVLRLAGGEERRLSEADALCGVLLQGDPLYGAYLSAHIEKLRRAEEGLALSSLPNRDARIRLLCTLRAQLEDRREEWEHGNGTGD
mgnify:FL=1